jgi:hypothetical protein
MSRLAVIGLIFCLLGGAPGKPLFAADQGTDAFKYVFKSQASGHDAANAYLLMLGSYYCYENAWSTKGFEAFKENFQQAFTRWGMTKFDFINLRKHTGDTQAVVMSNDHAIIVVFRGSEGSVNFVKGFYDWVLTDFNFFKKKVKDWGPNIKVHRGFYNAVDIVYSQLKTLINQHMGSSDKKVWVTGHSLGAGLAPLAALRLSFDRIPIQGVVFYGGPRVGNKAFVEAYQDRIKNTQRWVDDHDLVTMVPFTWMNFQHLVQPHNLYGDGKVVLLDREFSALKGKAAAHYPGLYLQRLYSALPGNLQMQVPPPPAFRLFVGPEDRELDEKYRHNETNPLRRLFSGESD